jgi:hypothetical protein
MNTHDDTDIEVSRIIRAIEAKMRAGQLGEAFEGLTPSPLITSLVPDGMDSPLRKKPTEKISIRKKVA